MIFDYRYTKWVPCCEHRYALNSNLADICKDLDKSGIRYRIRRRKGSEQRAIFVNKKELDKVLGLRHLA